MPHRFIPVAAAPLLSLLAVASAMAQTAPPFEGYLCCNMLSDGSWISDINYHGSGKQLVPAGTRVKVTGYGRWRLLVEIDGRALAIGNDYSRTLSMDAFAQRYVVAADPTAVLAAAPARVRDAVKAGKLVTGMNRAQVLMAVGYPIASYTGDLDAPLWRYWLDRSSEYQVFWGTDGRVERVFGAPAVRAKVTLE